MNTTNFDFDSLLFQQIEKSYTKVVVFNITLFFLIVLIGGSILQYFKPQDWFVFGFSVLGMFILWTLFYIYYQKELKNRKYAIQEDYIVYFSGLFSHTIEIIPFSRIQHTTIHQGWLSKKLGLAKVSFYTAGSDNETIDIKGLKYEKAQSLNSFVLNHLEDQVIEEEFLLDIEHED